MSDDNKPAHSPIGASSMYRWEKCPGSIKLSEGQPNKAGFAAQEGTAAHELIGLTLEKAFMKNKPVEEILLNHVTAIGAYGAYVEELRDKIGEANCMTHVEHSFDMGHIYPMLYGTADCVLIDVPNKHMHVIDYKHGENIVVEVENNSQLQYYATGALYTLPYKVATVSMHIVQPRAYHPDGAFRAWTVSVLDIIAFKARLIKAAQKTERADAPLQSGDHCQFCPARTICNARGQESAQSEFTPVVQENSFKFYSDPKTEFKPE